MTSSYQILLDELDENSITQLWSEIVQHKKELRTWLDWIDRVPDGDQYLAFMNNVRYEEQIGIQKVYVVKVEGQAVGEICFDDFDARTKSCNLGYWISPKFQNKGIMQVACKEAIDKAFQNLNVQKINVKSLGPNKPSYLLALKLGFKIDGVLRKQIQYHGQLYDQVVMSLFQDEWGSNR